MPRAMPLHDELAALPLDGFVRFKQVRRFFPITRPSWERGVREGRYPPRYRLGPGMVGYKASDVRALIDMIERGIEPSFPRN